MSRYLWLVLCCASGVALGAPAPVGIRFLLVVDTSRAMRDFKHDGRQVVFDMLYSGLSGRMREGDTIGLWTFNQQVSGGVYPMQVWLPGKEFDLANQATLFLKEQRYQRSGNLNAVFAQVLPLISTVKDVNVIILTSGQALLEQTNVTQDFMAAWQTKAPAAREGKLAVLIALEARNGKITRWSINTENQPLALPGATPPSPEKTGDTNPPPSAAREVLKNITASLTNQTRMSNPVTPLSAADQPKPNPPPAPIIIRRNPPVVTNALPAAQKPNEVSEEKPNPTPGASLASPATEKPNPRSVPPSITSTAAAPTAAAPQKGQSLAVPAGMETKTRSSASGSNAAPKLTSPAPPVATAVKPVSAFPERWLLWAGLGGLFVALGVAGLLWRRFRQPRARASIITQSMDRRT